MCGIVGYFNFNNDNSPPPKGHLDEALKRLNKRGPDFQSSILLRENHVGLGHARLSILDTSAAAHQPMKSHCGDYIMVFNGEVYNFKELRVSLEKTGDTFVTDSDTEVILALYKKEGKSCFSKLNGFFAIAIYHIPSGKLILVRDRMGIKPLYYSFQNEALYFASELKALLPFGVKKELDFSSLQLYLQFNYIPYPQSIFKNVFKLEPGHLALVEPNGEKTIECYYEIPRVKNYENGSYESAQNTLAELLEGAVQKRLVSDVPIGCFLSGGIDSSVISTLAAKHKKDLNTFSIGFKDNPYFDETEYANLVAKKIKSNHTVFSLSNDDLFEHLNEILDYTDEPFADSSAIPVFILSKRTKEHVTVALSGDGADEMFAGYNKHFAEWRARKQGIKNQLVGLGAPLWKALPKSRHSKLGNLFRQLDRFAEGQKLGNAERYWRWCAFSDENYPSTILKEGRKLDETEYQKRKTFALRFLSTSSDMNEALYTDMHQVLVNDMLTKVDTMSMANSLEVRVPFLDHELVNFAFSLPSSFKVNKHGRKTILKDAFRSILPPELYNRNKMGFEVPLLQWFQTDLKSLICDKLLSAELVERQGIFNVAEIEKLKEQLFSNNPGEIHAQIWALIVFQWWWLKNMDEN